MEITVKGLALPVYINYCTECKNLTEITNVFLERFVKIDVVTLRYNNNIKLDGKLAD